MTGALSYERLSETYIEVIDNGKSNVKVRDKGIIYLVFRPQDCYLTLKTLC